MARARTLLLRHHCPDVDAFLHDHLGELTINEVAVVTVNPGPRGRRGLDPDCIDIERKP